MTGSYLSTDVAYDEGTGYGIGVVFSKFTDDTPESIIEVIVPDVGEYVPGEFYKRELKVLLAIHEEYVRIHKKKPLCIFIDAYVDLGDKKGCGQYFADAIEDTSVVIGIAKNAYVPADKVCEKVLRGSSVKPLFVTSTIVPKEDAAFLVRTLHGEHRFPTLIKKADMLTKEFVKRIKEE
jgi:deoxyribonuclease V